MSTRKIQKTITLPDGDVMTMRKLSGKHLRRAAEAEMFEQADMLERLAALQTRVAVAMGKDTKEAPVVPVAEPVAAVVPVAEAPAVVAEPDPMGGYNKAALILKGMLSVEGEAFPDEAAREAYVDDLSQEDEGFAAEQILRLSSPKLFLTAAEREVAQKNG
jgi:hypothetical protein